MSGKVFRFVWENFQICPVNFSDLSGKISDLSGKIFRSVWEEEEEEDNDYNKKEEEDEDAKDKYVV